MMTEQDFAILYTAISKLESVVLRTPEIYPVVWQKLVKDAYEALRRYQEK